MKRPIPNTVVFIILALAVLIAVSGVAYSGSAVPNKDRLDLRPSLQTRQMEAPPTARNVVTQAPFGSGVSANEKPNAPSR
jgi:hypothetical protein